MKIRKPLVSLRQKAEVFFMYLPEYGKKYNLLEKYSPNDLIIYDMAMFYAVENGRTCGGTKPVEHANGYYELDVDKISELAWVSPEETISIIEDKFSDKLELLKVGDKYFIREKE